MLLVGADVLGDSVNIASRLQESAEEGCISISGAVYRDVKNKAGIEAEFLEDKTFKNVDEPVKVYKVHCEVEEQEPSTEQPSKRNKLLYYIIAGLVVVIAAILLWQVLITKETIPIIVESEEVEIDRSIAVLPFANLSDDPEQEYFSIGIMDEILMHLYKIGDLRVTSRTSVMGYKDTSKNIKEIADELGVAHILEGSVRKSGNKVRIIVQLIDPSTDQHLWAESYDRELADVFVIQSEVAK
jgi:TolB-like protein